MKSRWIIGGGACLDLACGAWRQARPDEAVQRIEVPQGADYVFDLSVLDALDPEQGAAFVAFDERFGNFKRMELVQAAMARGFKLEPFIHPSAVVSEGVVVGMNAFVDAQVVIGYGARVDYNAVLHAGVHVGPGCRIKSSCWLESGVRLGARVEIGGHCILRMGAAVQSGVKVGRGCELGWPRLYDEDIPAKTFFDPRYDEPIYVYDHENTLHRR